MAEEGGCVWSAEGFQAAKVNPRVHYITRSASLRCPPTQPWDAGAVGPGLPLPQPRLWLPLGAWVSCLSAHWILLSYWFSLQGFPEPPAHQHLGTGRGGWAEARILAPYPTVLTGHRSQWFGTQAPTSARA